MRDLKIIYVNSNKIVKRGFGTGKPIRSIESSTALIQKIIYHLYTELGSNYLSPKTGSRFSTLNRLNWSSDNDTVLKAAITGIISDIEDKIKKTQLITSNLEPDEILQKLFINSIGFDSTSLTWDISITMVTASNKQLTVTL